MLTPHAIVCPFCGESFGILLDTSIPIQQYIEDCQVCCLPITLSVEVDEDGVAQVRASGENDA